PASYAAVTTCDPAPPTRATRKVTSPASTSREPVPTVSATSSPGPTSTGSVVPHEPASMTTARRVAAWPLRNVPVTATERSSASQPASAVASTSHVKQSAPGTVGDASGAPSAGTGNVGACPPTTAVTDRAPPPPTSPGPL